ncbi:LOW QUALITY PROTEIN: hypothetical protein PHMEG_00016625 [Phytophthora megakarya]|uniref:Uncharacterized protein n=1 Tax=Phytophthora megakarya TaxID=4795 RepID=A0A225VYD0_9STRA|nr:LOW QUALITY PROTEIN: hypothetical protein PHMEG_00016625 [Phytophthora megakarya]
MWRMGENLGRRPPRAIKRFRCGFSCLVPARHRAIASKQLPDATFTEAWKVEKKATQRASPESTFTELGKNADRTLVPNVESELEDKAPSRAAKKPTKATIAKELDLRGPVDLSKVIASFQRGTSSITTPLVTADPLPMPSSSPAIPEVPSVVNDLSILKEEVLRVRGILSAQVTASGNPVTTGSPTTPNAKGELPPGEVSHLTSRSFPEGSEKARKDYNSPQAYMLAASRMFKSFGPAPGTPMSLMSFVL